MAGTSSLGIVVVVVLALIGSTQAQLQMYYYGTSCPKAEQIVKDYVKQHIPNAPSLAAALLRMHFHDCFVRVNLYPFFSTFFHYGILHFSYNIYVRYLFLTSLNMLPYI